MSLFTIKNPNVNIDTLVAASKIFIQLYKLSSSKEVTKKDMEIEIVALLEDFKKMTIDDEKSKEELQLKLDHLMCGILAMVLAKS